MTDIMKLIERANKATEWAGTVAADILKESVSAIEALQAENERLKASLHYEVECVREISAERDALQAKLDVLQTQDPVAYGDAARRRGKQVGALWQFDDLGLSMFVGEIIGQYNAAPKALEPLTDEQILEAIRNAPKMQTTYAGWVRDQRIAWGRAILAAPHGITKGTP